MGEDGAREGVQVRVEGRVQGVGFRWYTRDCAIRLGLAGSVRNLPDGAVEAVAVGSHVALSAWVEVVRRGPPMGRVLSCSVQSCSVQALTESGDEHDGFVILH